MFLSVGEVWQRAHEINARVNVRRENAREVYVSYRR